MFAGDPPLFDRRARGPSLALAATLANLAGFAALALHPTRRDQEPAVIDAGNAGIVARRQSCPTFVGTTFAIGVLVELVLHIQNNSLAVLNVSSPILLPVYDDY